MKAPRILTEKDFQQQVVDAAHLFGWWVFHDYDARKNEPGFPDLVLIRPPRVLFLELKRETGRCTRAQEKVLGMLDECPGVEAGVVRPSGLKHLLQQLS